MQIILLLFGLLGNQISYGGPVWFNNVDQNCEVLSNFGSRRVFQFEVTGYFDCLRRNRIEDRNLYKKYTLLLFIQPKIFAFNFFGDKILGENNLARPTPVLVRVVGDQELELLDISNLHL